MNMTADEFVGRTKQAVKTAKDALNEDVVACTPESHKSVVTALKSLLDINEAQVDYFANGFGESIATRVAKSMKEGATLTINGKDIKMPSFEQIRKMIVTIGVVLLLAFKLFSHDAPSNISNAANQQAHQNQPSIVDKETLELVVKLLAGIPMSQNQSSTNGPTL